MGCGSCSTGGCKTGDNGLPKGCKSNGSCGVGGCGSKLDVFDWLAGMELPYGTKQFDCVEVRFKNGRKAFFKNHENLELFTGDVVAVESSPGHDIGVISLTGELVRLQMRKKKIDVNAPEVKKIYRKARPADIEKWHEAQKLEEETMYKARTIAVKLNLQMKISDVEYQGDKTKATFFYTADDRVDFRELIKLLAEEFRVRIEMRQIGARQESSRLGGIGSCGRELCCSTWLTDFRSVTTTAARYQQLALNPLKLAGQCGKLKCCLNFELDTYLDALKNFPETELQLKTAKGNAFHQKTDIFKNIMWYSYSENPNIFIEVKTERVKEIIDLNKKGILPEELVEGPSFKATQRLREPDFENVVGQDDIHRFDKSKNNNQQKRNQNNNQNQRNNNQRPDNRNRQQNQQNAGAERPARNPENQNSNAPRPDNRNKPPQNVDKPIGNEGNPGEKQNLNPNQRPNNNKRRHHNHRKPNPNNPNKPNSNNENA